MGFIDRKKRVELEFKVEAFMNDIRLKSGSQSLRDIAIVIGVSASTLSRMDSGKPPDMQTFMKVCGVLQMQPGNYFDVITWERKD